MPGPTRAVLKALGKNPSRHRHGFEIATEADLAPGTIYPILARLEAAGLLMSAWEGNYDPVKAGRPRRRYYWLSGEGVPVARAVTDSPSRLSWKAARGGLVQ